MTREISNERQAALPSALQEALDFEIKGWLNLQDPSEDRATLAKAIMAIANHGGGRIVLGLVETETGAREADERPASLGGYSQDLVNGIVQKYCDPPFHCAVRPAVGPGGALFPVVHVPGGHRVPVRARRAGPNERIVRENAIYVRKPGPRSEAVQTGAEWDALLGRCVRIRLDDMLKELPPFVRDLVGRIEEPALRDRLDEWIASGFARWEQLVQPLPAGVGPRFPHGHYLVAYEIIGEHKQVAPARLPVILQASVVRHGGWPPFSYPTHEGIPPSPVDDAAECWLAGVSGSSAKDIDAAHADFWRVRPDGLAFLLRGYQEDSVPADPPGRGRVPPSTLFDIALPVWRIGETLLQAQKVAAHLFAGPTAIRFVAKYAGLAGRQLASLDGCHDVRAGMIARQDSIRLDAEVDSRDIDTNLPAIIHRFLAPLYSRFGFYDLPMQLVVHELDRMGLGSSG